MYERGPYLPPSVCVHPRVESQWHSRQLYIAQLKGILKISGLAYTHAHAHPHTHTHIYPHLNEDGLLMTWNDLCKQFYTRPQMHMLRKSLFCTIAQSYIGGA